MPVIDGGSSPIDYSTIEQIKLDKLRFELSKRLQKSYFHDTDVDVIVDYLDRDFIVRYNTTLLADKFTEDIYIARYPNTIWQYFKERYLPSWIRKKYPVKYTKFKTKIKHYHTFPYLYKYIKDEYGEEAATFYTYESLEYAHRLNSKGEKYDPKRL